jgi:hypothetical protein
VGAAFDEAAHFVGNLKRPKVQKPKKRRIPKLEPQMSNRQASCLAFAIWF